MSHVIRQTYLCSKCGIALENFFSHENQCWYTAHSRLKATRDQMQKDFFCPDADKVFVLPTVTLHEPEPAPQPSSPPATREGIYIYRCPYCNEDLRLADKDAVVDSYQNVCHLACFDKLRGT